MIQTPHSSTSVQRASRVLATDLDGTLIPLKGDAEAIDALAEIRAYLGSPANSASAHSPCELPLVFVTGRHFESVLEAIEQHDLPQPDWILCDVGTSAYQRQAKETTFQRDESYDKELESLIGDVDVEQLRQELGQLPGFKLQEPWKQGCHKLSYYVDGEEIEQHCERARGFLSDQNATCAIIGSVDPFNGDGLLDVLPEGVSKSYAIEWWRRKHDFHPEEIVFCGDSGNDTAALIGGYRAVLVGNAHRSLAEGVYRVHCDSDHNTKSLYLATRSSTSGVLDGARWFGLMDSTPNFGSINNNASTSEQWGAKPINHLQTHFRVYAPTHEQVWVQLHTEPARRLAMNVAGDGFHDLIVDNAPVGTRYAYGFSKEGHGFPDPASRFQPEGVHGSSQVVATHFPWQHDDVLRVQNREDLILYEMHIGAFTQEGTYLAAIDRLDELVDLGITGIELMPLAQSPGDWNWGYDGTHWFAPSNNHGTPDDFKRFVDAAHGRGLLVILDVVYNHFGPEGNYWSQFGPYTSSKHQTPWGDAPNFDDPVVGPAIRRFVTDNAVYWLDELHVDGLRVDAIHCMADDSDKHITTELGEAVHDWSKRTGRPAWLIAESNVYDPTLLTSLEEGGSGFTAEWSDDFVHSVLACVRPSEQLTTRTYEPGTDLEKALRRGFVFHGTVRGYRGRDETPTADRVDTTPLIVCIQNHDFIGNHPLGARLHQITSLNTQAAAAGLMMMLPSIPMLFMGEEFACENPFQFFVNFGDQALRQAVVEGRKREYPQHDWANSVLPTERAAMANSRIGVSSGGNQQMRAWYQQLISLRKALIRTGLLLHSQLSVDTDVKAGLFRLNYRSSDGNACVLTRFAPHPSTDTASDSQSPDLQPIQLTGLVDLPSIVVGDSRVALRSAKSPHTVSAIEPNHTLILTSDGIS